MFRQPSSRTAPCNEMASSSHASNGGSAPATPGFTAVAPEWLFYGAAHAAPAIPAAESTLGSHPCVALSSAQVLPEWTTATSPCNAFQRTAITPLTLCLTPGVHFRDFHAFHHSAISTALFSFRGPPACPHLSIVVFAKGGWPAAAPASVAPAVVWPAVLRPGARRFPRDTISAPVTDFQLAVFPFAYHYLALAWRIAALPLYLEQRFVSHHPVVADRAPGLQPERFVQFRPARPAAVIVPCAAAARANRLLCSARYSPPDTRWRPHSFGSSCAAVSSPAGPDASRDSAPPAL
jgi:hypothetical protein